ncbi:SCO family protein [Ramlibacter albus]|uniref:Transmembrane protein n=1 Tax=Ramlibacter albus TaxID=2079448 RepID=A0A923S0A2_9BURK|nr:hypothetical protein [Ramlibacter albus]MBC5763129.1 hypothetical protein [Ramlibacter albus]
MSGSNSSAHPAQPERLDEPLGLTVHSLPVPQEAALAEEQRTVSGRWKMLAVLAVCAAPVVASYFTYYVVRPEGRRNYGELIMSQPELPAQLAQLKGQWLLVSVAGGACEAACEKHLYLQRQLREGLGKDKDRVDWVWIVSDRTPVRDALKPALAEATVVQMDEAQLSQWLAPAQGHALRDHLYVVDPQGRWMMRFPAGQDIGTAPKVKRDLERLLRASASWDKAGR